MRTSQNKKSKEKFSPFNLVLFGGTGDLAFRKIYPAFYFKILEKTLHRDFTLIVAHREELVEQEFIASLQGTLKEAMGEQYEQSVFEALASHFRFVRTVTSSADGYKALSEEINSHANRYSIFYFSTPSSAFGEIANALKQADLITPRSKVVLEKPLGNDLASAIAINDSVQNVFNESQIYRIDHYLGKETVQNLMVLRFANNLFERAWNSDSIDNVQITVSESLGVESRAAYYDKSGALRDMIQNHLLQLLCLVAMEPPVSLDADNVRDEKLKVLKALRFFDSESIANNTVKGQYTRGIIGNREVNSYLEDIEQYDSQTETFVALKAFVDNWRWKDVPFYLRTGKRMNKRYSDIVINFKPVKHDLFPTGEPIKGNRLRIRLQPEERIELLQMTKIPGPGGYRYKPISLKLDYMDSFDKRLPDAYERLITDVIRGNQTLFMRFDELSAAWRWTESIIKHWEQKNIPNVLYASGSWGPGDELMNGLVSWVNDDEPENVKV